MCGIVGVIGSQNVVPLLLNGLKKLEYRGYDSAGVLIHDGQTLIRQRAVGQVKMLENLLMQEPISGHLGIAHTRWATHGDPSLINAHPHWCRGEIALVHNGIIENHQLLRDRLKTQGYQFETQTDSEVIVYLLHSVYQQQGIQKDPLKAISATVEQLTGAYALAIVFREYPERLYAVRHGSPLLIGLREGQYSVASDQLALSELATQTMALEDGDIAVLCPLQAVVYDLQGSVVLRPVEAMSAPMASYATRGTYRHYMQKEIFEQASVLTDTLTYLEHLDINLFAGSTPPTHIHLVACGSSYHAGLVARYYFEQAGVATQVEVASEYRYRQVVVRPHTWFVAISQSGETADTLSALKLARTLGYEKICVIVNVPGSAMTRLADQVFYTQAGPEIGVASTKAFTTQLLVLLYIAQVWLGNISRRPFASLAQAVNQIFSIEPAIEEWAVDFADKHHALFLGRGVFLPIVQEGALKLKEISYIHAEAYPAGELKHGPLALVDKDMPVLVVAPQNDLLLKIKSNLEEVRARGGQLYVLSDDPGVLADPLLKTIQLPKIDPVLAPLVLTIPLQLLAYHVALVRGTDVDRPRNLAKSVTVE